VASLIKLKIFFLAVFFLSFGLFTPAVFALQDAREIRIYIPPILGSGSSEDNAYFYKQLTAEVASQYHAVVRLESSSDYTLRGRIQPFACNHDPFDICPLHIGLDPERNDHSDELIFYVELVKTSTQDVIGVQYIAYTRISSRVEELLSVIVYNMLSWIPDIIMVTDTRDNWLFFGINALWLPRLYGEVESLYWLNFGAGLTIQFQFLDFMVLNVGVQISQDWIRVSEVNHLDTILDIPLALGFVFKISGHLLLEIYGGYSFNFSLLNVTEPSSRSWFAGLQLGVRAGPGFITIEPRFTMDFFNSRLIQSEVAPMMDYSRNMIQLAIGYKIGVLKKR